MKAKICGITTREAAETAIRHGAAWLGCVFYPPSPRHLTAAKAGEILQGLTIPAVGVFVDAGNSDIAAILAEAPLKALQLHGKETPERVKEVRQRFGLPVVKAMRIQNGDDIAAALAYRDVADMLLFDARAPEGGGFLPGGNGLAFDWALLKGREFGLPWFLSGGLSAANLREAIAASGAQMVDVSSGVERAPGIKSPELVREFLEATRNQ